MLRKTGAAALESALERVRALRGRGGEQQVIVVGVGAFFAGALFGVIGASIVRRLRDPAVIRRIGASFEQAKDTPKQRSEPTGPRVS